MMMHKALYQRKDIDFMCQKRRRERTHQQFEEYTKESKEILLIAAINSNINRINKQENNNQKNLRKKNEKENNCMDMSSDKLRKSQMRWPGYG